MARYLPRAINSLIQQTHKNIEIILIDDGSTDDSGTICDTYAIKDSRIRVIHQRNQGVSAARNTGLKLVQGDYVCFFDPDDFVAPDIIECLLYLIKKNKSDISVCAWDDYYTNHYIPYSHVVLNGVYTGQEAILLQFKYGFYSACNMLYKRSVIHGIQFDEKYINGEDRLFVTETFLNSKQVAYDMSNKTAKYHYCHRENSAGTKKFTTKDYGLIEVCDKVYENLKKNGNDGEKIAARHKILSMIQLLKMMDGKTDKYAPYGNMILRDLRKNIKMILFNNRITILEKITVIIFSISPKIAFYLRQMKQKMNMCF